MKSAGSTMKNGIMFVMVSICIMTQQKSGKARVVLIPVAMPLLNAW